jgi:large subunit ribosomal protein L5
MNPMRKIRIEKVTLNIGCGKDQSKLDKAVKLLKSITNIDPIKTFAKKRIPDWGLRPGLPIGCKITLRKNAAIDLLNRLLKAKSFKLRKSCFNEQGNISFGLEEYIDIPGVKYDPEIGIMGLETCITLERPGFRIKRRKLAPKKIPKREWITREEAIEFMQKNFNVKIGEEE